MTLSQDDLLSQLRVRGLEEGFQRTPLREFKGKLGSLKPNMVERFQPPRLEILFNFEELDMASIESTEPYPFPIAQISIFHSNRKASFYGVFAGSVDTLINAGLPADAPADQVKGMDFLIGKILHMKLTGGHMMWDRDKGEETPRECWELIGVEGVTAGNPAPATTKKAAAPAPSGISSTDQAINLLDGKNEQEWYQVVFQDPVVKVDGDLVNSILQRTFLPPLLESGQLTKDEDGRYHKV